LVSTLLVSEMRYYTYILECGDSTLYTGIATDVRRRFKEHVEGKGAKYTKSRGVKKILFEEKHKDRSSALKREVELKRLSRKEKLELVKSNR
jgi:putative endonuclease